MNKKDLIQNIINKGFIIEETCLKNKKIRKVQLIKELRGQAPRKIVNENFVNSFTEEQLRIIERSVIDCDSEEKESERKENFVKKVSPVLEAQDMTNLQKIWKILNLNTTHRKSVLMSWETDLYGRVKAKQRQNVISVYKKSNGYNTTAGIYDNRKTVINTRLVELQKKFAEKKKLEEKKTGFDWIIEPLIKQSKSSGELVVCLSSSVKRKGDFSSYWEINGHLYHKEEVQKMGYMQDSLFNREKTNYFTIKIKNLKI